MKTRCIEYISVLLFRINDGCLRINLTLWDELAHVAFQHVEKGQQIYVSGRLVSDTVENDDGKQQTYYKVFSFIHTLFYHIIFPFAYCKQTNLSALLQVVVQELNFVERNSSSMTLNNRDSNYMTAGKL